ncbi:MAG: sulfotransferase [Devosia nanyangense]|uniref:Sulfotransferase n=1 Tax=Devosia nanyangense TaxID=1228055 RepID=A0A933L1F5_9HYPH|nr:sulfotransferase [Devosia nanyangense]
MTDTTFDQLMEHARQGYARARPDEAIAALSKATLIAQSVAQLREVYRTHRRFGRFEHALAVLREIMMREPGIASDYLQLALTFGFTEINDDVRAMLALDERATEPKDRAVLGFALGKVFQDLGEIDRSFAYYARANAEHRRTLTYSIDDAAAEIDATIRTFDADLMRRFEGKGDPEASPIFIVGLPRSGSTLTEQILATHQDVYGGGEMHLMGSVAGTMRQQAGSVAAFLATNPDLRPWANAYLSPVLDALRIDGRGKSRFTDKQLDNFKRIGLIKLLFPRARIIRCLRDPLDNLFTIFRRPFGGNNVAYSYDQQELAAYYRLYRKMMAHWHDLLPGAVLDVSYEQLVADPEPSMRRLLDFCGLDWDPACLEFHRTERGIPTNSFAQVRQPLYADSIGMAQAYRPFIAPLVAAVAG